MLDTKLGPPSPNKTRLIVIIMTSSIAFHRGDLYGLASSDSILIFQSLLTLVRQSQDFPNFSFDAQFDLTCRLMSCYSADAARVSSPLQAQACEVLLVSLLAGTPFHTELHRTISDELGNLAVLVKSRRESDSRASLRMLDEILDLKGQSDHWEMWKSLFPLAALGALLALSFSTGPMVLVFLSLAFVSGFLLFPTPDQKSKAEIVRVLEDERQTLELQLELAVQHPAELPEEEPEREAEGERPKVSMSELQMNLERLTDMLGSDSTDVSDSTWKRIQSCQEFIAQQETVAFDS